MDNLKELESVDVGMDALNDDAVEGQVAGLEVVLEGNDWELIYGNLIFIPVLSIEKDKRN